MGAFHYCPWDAWVDMFNQKSFCRSISQSSPTILESKVSQLFVESLQVPWCSWKTCSKEERDVRKPHWQTGCDPNWADLLLEFKTTYWLYPPLAEDQLSLVRESGFTPTKSLCHAFQKSMTHSLLSPKITLFAHVMKRATKWMWFLMAGRIPHLLSIKPQNGIQWRKLPLNRCKVLANSILQRRRQKLREWSPLILAILGPWHSLYRVRWRIAAAICIQTYWRGSCARAKADNDGRRGCL